MKFLRGLISEFLNRACFVLDTKHMVMTNYMLKHWSISKPLLLLFKTPKAVIIRYVVRKIGDIK
jgi:hypothetical protein